MKKTKIIATIGPSSLDKKTLSQMIEHGMNAIRINTAHGDLKQYKKIISNLKSINKEIPVLIDVKGPEIRIFSNKKHILKRNETIEIHFKKGNLFFNHQFKAKKGQKVLINDGIYELEIKEITKEKAILKALMDLSITNKVRANLPGIAYDMPILSEKDKETIKALKKDIDFLALSYVRNKNDILNVKKYLNDEKIKIISKIENIEAVKNFDEILEESNGIMIARGDLGVELSSEKIPIIQKQIIKKCNNAGKVVITATQMLQTMIESQIPTRAETSDVANAILDGTDAVMLSGETANGKYPVHAVKEMSKIAKEVEPYVKNNVFIEKAKDLSEGVAKSIYELSNLLPITKIIAFTHTGYTAKLISRFRLKQNIFAVTSNKNKELELYYGIKPIMFPDMPLREKILKLTQYLLKKKFITEKDLILYSAGTKPGFTNIIEIHKVEELISKMS